MLIDIDETTFRVTPSDGDDKHLIGIIIRNIASYIDPSYTYKRKSLLERYKNNAYMREKWEKWKGNINLFEQHRDYFVVNGGLIIPFLRTAVLYGIDYEINDLKQPVVEATPIEFGGRIQLYDYQQEIIDEIKKNDGCGLISAPTGSGKTIVGTEITSVYNTPTIIIADKVNILKQWIKEFTKTRKSNLEFKKIKSVYIGYVGDDPRILLCTSLFLAPYYNNSRKIHDDIEHIISNCGLLIYDEVHRAGSESGITILENCQARYRIGLSATLMKRTDGKDLEYVSRIGQPIAHIKVSRLLKDNKVVPVDVYFKPVRRVGTRRMNYEEAKKKCIIENEDRNEKIVDAVLEFMSKDLKFIIFVDNIVHAQELSGMTGVDWTDSKDKERDRKFDDLRTGNIAGIICTYELAGLGFNLPSLDGLIFAGAGKSANKFIQAKGRITRIFGEKEKGIIIDFADTSKYFDDHAYQRYNIYSSERGVNVHAKGTWLYGK